MGGYLFYSFFANMSIKWILLAVFLLVTVAYCQDDNYSYDTPDNEDSYDESDDEDPNGSEEVIITGNISNKKMTFQILDLASDIRSDIAFVLNIPTSSVRILSLDDNGSTYTALVELLDSASLSAEEAANELRTLEA